MSEDITIRLNLEQNIEESASVLDRFHETVRRQISTLGSFETEVTNLGSAMSLAMEQPRPKAAAFFSLLKVGLDQAKGGGAEAARGISTMGLALQSISERAPLISGIAPIFGKISDYAKTAGSTIDWVKRIFGGFGADMSNVMQMTSDMGETLRVQAYAMKSAFQDEVIQLRAIVSERQKEIGSLEKLFAQQSMLQSSYEQEKLKNQERAASLQGVINMRQRDLDLAQRRVDIAEQELADAIGRGVSADKEIALLEKLNRAELGRDKVLGDISKKQLALQSLQERSNDLDSKSVNVKQNLIDIGERLGVSQASLAKEQDEYNKAIRVQGPLLRQADSHIMDVKTSLKRLEVGWENNKEVNKRWVNQAVRALRLYRQEVERMRKSGMELPAEFTRSFSKTTKLVDIWKSRLKEQEKAQKAVKKSTDDLAASTDKYGKSIAKITGKEVAAAPGMPRGALADLGVAGGAIAGISTQVNATTRILTRSLSSIIQPSLA